MSVNDDIRELVWLHKLCNGSVFVFDYLKENVTPWGMRTQDIHPAKTSRLFNCVQLCEIEILIKYKCSCSFVTKSANLLLENYNEIISFS